jgi:TerY-like protein
MSVTKVDRQERSLVCTRCGFARPRDAGFCAKCGTPTESSSDPSSSHRVSASREAILIAGARCTSTKRPFAIRFEQGVSGIWQACAAFAISERQLSNPAFSIDQITSSVSLSPSYRGCPHCGADPRRNFAGVSFIKCSCGKLACSPGIIGAETICPWCDRIGILVRHSTVPVFGIKDR